MAVQVIPLAIMAAQAIAGAVAAAKANRERKKQEEEMKRQMAQRPDAEIPGATKEALADARSSRYATNPAIPAAWRQLQMGAAAQQAAAQRNATSGAEALAAGAAAQANLQSAAPQMMAAQTAYTDQKQAQYQLALGQMAGAEMAVQQDQLNKNAERANIALGQVGAANANKAAGMQMAASALSSAAYMAGNGNGNTARTAPTPEAIQPMASRGIAPIGQGQVVPPQLMTQRRAMGGFVPNGWRYPMAPQYPNSLQSNQYFLGNQW